MIEPNTTYSNYISRQPNGFGRRIVITWHRNMLNEFQKKLSIDTGSMSLLEIGPGYGYLADVLRERGHYYRFDDIADPVIRLMREKGFELVESHYERFDIVWLSHVLEHSVDWVSAREMLIGLKSRLTTDSYLVIIAPDYLDWGKKFYDVDATHGYPTTLRTVTQLVRDIELEVVWSGYHRGAKTSLIWRFVFGLLSLIPNTVGKLVTSPVRRRFGENLLFSLKTVFGWRQIMVVARLK